MRLDQMPHFSKPTLAVFPFRDFQIGWRWHLRALKLFPDFNLQWARYFYDSGDGHARGTAYTDHAEAMSAANEFNQHIRELISQAVTEPVHQASITLKVEKALTAARRIHDEEALMESEAIRRNAHLPRPAIQDLELPASLESLRAPLHEQLELAPYLRLVALKRFNSCLARTSDLKWESLGALNTKLSKACFRETTARGFGISGLDHWGKTKAQIRAMLLPRANQLLQLAGIKQMLAEARARGQKVLVIGGFVFWYEEDGTPGWVVKRTDGGSDGDNGTTLWHEGTILSKNHGRIVVLPYIKANGDHVQGHTKNSSHDGKAKPRHPDHYVTLPFEVLDGDLMIGLFGELPYE